MLLEKDLLDLRQLNSMVSSKLPRPKECFGLFRGSKSAIDLKGSVSYRIWTSVILLLMWPATFGAHLLTSAVNWKSASEYRPLNQTAGSSGTVVSTPAWRAYLESTTDRRETMIRATRNVGIITFNTEPLKPDYCRHVVRGQDLAVDSKVDNDTFPCFDC